MDILISPDLMKLLLNPVSFAVVVSSFWESTPLFQDETKSDYLKLGIIALSCLIWAMAVALLSPSGVPTTPAGWASVIEMGLAVFISTQGVHILINKMFPWLGAFLKSLPNQTTVSTVTAASSTGTSSTATTVTTSAPDATTTTIDQSKTPPTGTPLVADERAVVPDTELG